MKYILMSLLFFPSIFAADQGGRIKLFRKYPFEEIGYMEIGADGILVSELIKIIESGTYHGDKPVPIKASSLYFADWVTLDPRREYESYEVIKYHKYASNWVYVYERF